MPIMRVESVPDVPIEIGPREKAFIQTRNSFHMASVGTESPEILGSLEIPGDTKPIKRGIPLSDHDAVAVNIRLSEIT